MGQPDFHQFEIRKKVQLKFPYQVDPPLTGTITGITLANQARYDVALEDGTALSYVDQRHLETVK